MQTIITQRTLAKLDPTGIRFFVWDTSLTGFGVEVSAKGKASYVCETRIRGTSKKVRKKIGLVDLLPLDDARQEARSLLLKASQGFDIWTCRVYIPVSELIYAAFRSNAKGLLLPSDE